MRNARRVTLEHNELQNCAADSNLEEIEMTHRRSKDSDRPISASEMLNHEVEKNLSGLAEAFRALKRLKQQEEEDQAEREAQTRRSATA
jgi:hypothetical protein